jgi:hypothetical protein
MGALSTLLDGPGLVVVLIASGLGLLAMGGLTLVQGRSDIKRRTSEGAAAPAAGPRAEAQSLFRLVAYLETTLAGGDPREAKRIRTQLTRPASSIGAPSGSSFRPGSGARSCSAPSPPSGRPCSSRIWRRAICGSRRPRRRSSAISVRPST